MILCVDGGNTRLKWGIHDGACWQAAGALPLAEAGQLGKVLPPLALTQALGCNVAGAALAATVEAALTPLAVTWNGARAEQCGVINHYDYPEQLGADRWAALIGARSLTQHDGGPCLVVMAGTATTIDLLDGQGDFLGGLILPGLDLMRSALARNTAQLPPEPGQFQAFPRNTRDAISSGALQATLGAIERMYGQLGDGPRARCLLSGGAAGALLPYLTLPVLPVDNLVLEGLARIGAQS